MEQFDREYFAERKARIIAMHRLRLRLWGTVIAGVVFSLAVSNFRHHLYSDYGYHYHKHWTRIDRDGIEYGVSGMVNALDDKLRIIVFNTTPRELIKLSESVQIAGLAVFAIAVFLMFLWYLNLRSVHHAIQQEYEDQRAHRQSHEKAKRSGYEYEYEEVKWYDDDDEFLDDMSLEEQVRMRIYSDD